MEARLDKLITRYNISVAQKGKAHLSLRCWAMPRKSVNRKKQA